MKEERDRLERQRITEEGEEAVKQMATLVEAGPSSAINTGFRIHAPEEHVTGEDRSDDGSYRNDNDNTKIVWAALMAINSGQTEATDAPEAEVIHFTAPPPTPTSPATEWVTSPHSWRPPADVQTNNLEWTQNEDASFKAEHIVIPRLPSDAEYIQWKGNKEVQQNVARPPHEQLVTQGMQWPATAKPISRIIEEFPQDLLPTFIGSTLPPNYHETNEVWSKTFILQCV
ncbi:unnamed protein product [Strongylus vulgaris]|uniref:Uncharacterized protein n=1 Tax=Strongylus vulgaris TaxID=40348 RepID=A0A3P7L3D3_STRVU|nr:unnamed protein product [Strongylus vulgaris]